MWVAEVDRHSGGDSEGRVVRHLLALIPGDAAHQFARQGSDRLAHGSFERGRTVVLAQMHQQHEARRAFNERADRTGVIRANDEVALPVPGHGTVLDLRGSLTNHHHVRDNSPFLGAAVRFSFRSSRAQASGELSTQFPSALHVEGLVDGLVADAH